MTNDDFDDSAERELVELHRQISYLQETLTAISSGGVDAVIIGEPEAEQVYTLTSADRPYRVIVERMGEGAATVSERGVILFANPQLAHFLGVDRDSMIGRDITDYVDDDQQTKLSALLGTRTAETWRTELAIRRPDGTDVPVLVAVTALEMEGVLVRCLVFTDLTMQKQVERQFAEDSAQAERQRVAREVNDTIVQGLVTAEMALDLERFSEARQAIASTSLQARRWIGELAVDHQVDPGTAVRSAPAAPIVPEAP
ncbi:MAG: domain S-box-containing protein [Marmoricola sp.]|nr:domain S-box-containing protein [Marmoricola sp.]